MEKTPVIETERLILRGFTENDAEALFAILSDSEVNTFLPWFPLQTLQEAETFLWERYLHSGERSMSFHYAVCLQSDKLPIGYVSVSDGESHDLGYGLKKEFWRRGITTEACRGVLERLRAVGLPFVTATHDVNNPGSGRVMQKLGMRYCYTYQERVQPKDTLVTFRMYQLNLDGQEERVYRGYWESRPVHYVEEDV